MSFNFKICGVDDLLLSEYCIHFYNDLIKLLCTSLVIYLDWYKEQTICLISFNKRSELLPAFTCASAIGNLWSICLGLTILSPVPLVSFYFDL